MRARRQTAQYITLQIIIIIIIKHIQVIPIEHLRRRSGQAYFVVSNKNQEYFTMIVSDILVYAKGTSFSRKMHQMYLNDMT